MQAHWLKKIYNKSSSAVDWEDYWVTRLFERRLIDKKKRDGHWESCQKAYDSPKAIWQACKIG